MALAFLVFICIVLPHLIPVPLHYNALNAEPVFVVLGFIYTEH